MTMWSLLTLAVAASAAPVAQDLDTLVLVALERDPEARALSATSAASRSLARAATRPMDPTVMVGVEALGTMPDAPMPTMGMATVTQMIGGFGSYRAAAERLRVDADRGEIDQERVAAELRAELWRTAARIAALGAEHRLLDERVETAEELLRIGLARYGAGARVSAAPPVTPPSQSALTGTAPPAVSPRPASSAGMGGMPGMSMGTGRAPAAGDMGTDPGMASMGGDMGPMRPMPMGGGPGLGSLLRLDAEAARVTGQRDAVAARHAGELQRLALYVGEQAADRVAANPTAFLGARREAAPPPELALAGADVRAAEADLRAARTERSPDLMLSAGVRAMRGPMFGGVDLGVGVTVPVWGGVGQRIDAAKASVVAAEARRDEVHRALALAREAAEAELAAAEANARALEQVAVPRARQGIESTLALYVADRATAEEAVAAWATALDVEREAISARLAAEAMAADLDRLEGT
jgi:outer membrane protein TolC